MNNEQFSLQIGTFEGPLDLLLGLIQERKLYINEISLAQVTNEYVNYVSRLSALPIAETAQFVLIAATLLLIKSRSLLPHLELTEEEEGSIEELERRLAQYRITKECARLLGSRWNEAPLFWGAQRTQEVRSFAPAEASVETIVRAGERIVSALPVSEFRQTAEIAKILSLEEMIDQLERRIMQAAKTTFGELTAESSREEVVVQFLALLELMRSGVLHAAQSGAFDTIAIERDAHETPRYA